MLKPFLHRVLLKMEDVEEVDETFKAVRAAGLAIPEMAKEKEQNAVVWGTVVSVGPTAFNDYGGDPSWLKAGDKVVIAKYSGKQITVGKEKFTVVNDEDVVAVLEGESND